MFVPEDERRRLFDWLMRFVIQRLPAQARKRVAKMEMDENPSLLLWTVVVFLVLAKFFSFFFSPFFPLFSSSI